MIKTVAAALTCGACMILIAPPSQAQSRDYRIPRGSLQSALDSYTRQSGRQIIYKIEEVRRSRSPGVRGNISAGAALEAILAGTGFRSQTDSSGALAIVSVAVADGSDGPTDEIIVTATRRNESKLDVPLSIAAFGQRQLDTKGVKDIGDLARITPGLTFTPAAGGASNIAIRGINSDVGSGTTGVYIDDTPIQVRFLGQGLTSTNAYPYLFDLDRVEVLRGPQGTLFGAGSEGGTVRFIAPEPDLRNYSAYARAEIAATTGGGPSYETGIAAGGPIAADQVGFRVSAFHRRDGGWVDRVAYPVTPGAVDIVAHNANRTDVTVLRGALALAPTNALTITPSVNFQETSRRDTNQYWRSISSPSQGQFYNALPIRQPGNDRFFLYATKLEYKAHGFSVFANTSFFSRDESSTADYSPFIGELLGFNYNASLDLGYTAPSISRNRQRVFTQEVRVQSTGTGNRFSWVVGGFYQNARQTAIQTIPSDLDLLSNGLFGVPALLAFGADNLPGGISYQANDQARDRQLAGFGQVDYRMGKLTVTAGVRVAGIKLDFLNSQMGPLNQGGATGGNGRQAETPVTPKFGLKYNPSDSILLYATAAKGYRNGGYNPAVPAVQCAVDLAAYGLIQVPPRYKSDSVWSYEAGVKGQLLDRLAEIEGSAFRVDWSQIQNSVTLQNCGFNFVGNLGSAKSQGFDLRIKIKPVRGLSLEGATAYTNARYGKTITSGAGTLITAGDKLRVAPWHVSLATDYQFPVSQEYGLDAYVNATYDFDSDFRYGPGPTTTFFDPVTQRQASTSFMAARLGVRTNRYDLSLFAQNLLNSHSVISISHDTLLSTLVRERTFRPLMIGLTASARY